jgi:hypothetical protein
MQKSWIIKFIFVFNSEICGTQLSRDLVSLEAMASKMNENRICLKSKQLKCVLRDSYSFYITFPLSCVKKFLTKNYYEALFTSYTDRLLLNIN